jgi:hypothetical protein
MHKRLFGTISGRFRGIVKVCGKIGESEGELKRVKDLVGLRGKSKKG